MVWEQFVVMLGTQSALAAAWWGYRAYLKDLRVRDPHRRLRHAPRRRLHELTEGAIVRVRGTVEAFDHERLTAPLSGRPCLAYTLVIHGPPDHRGRRDVIFHSHASLSFWLHDTRGRLLVCAQRAALVLARQEHKDVDVNRLPEEARRKVAEAQPLFTFRTEAPTIHEEGLLLTDAPVAAAGRVQRDQEHGDEAAGGYRQQGSGWKLVDFDDQTPLVVGTTEAALRT